MTMLVPPKQNRLKILLCLVGFAAAIQGLGAQTAPPRITSEISTAQVSPLKSSLRPWAQAQLDAGRMPTSTKLTGMTLVFNRTPAQQADLEALLAAQQDPSSPQYHQWLTPDQFAARFGMTQSDLEQIQTWLQQQGFSIDWVARSRTMIRFSGTAGQVEQAFQTEMHYYQVDGAKHFAPSTALSLPAAFASTVEDVRNLSDFRPKPMHITARAANVTPQFTSSVSGNVFLAPGDIKVAYDMNPLLSAGFTGVGQTIAVMGQSEISASDIEAFQSAAGLPVKDPTSVIVPGTGNAAFYSGDEAESDLDLEWAGGIAPGANLFFVYTGDSSNSNGVFDSIAYSADENIGNIISVSYGACETALNGFSLESVLQQAAAQGQTVVAASGDEGSTSCFGDTGLTTAQQQALAVNYPASSDYVTGVGGTEMTSADIKGGSSFSTYWNASSGSGGTSLIKYVPEVAWNDDATSGSVSAASGGGLSASGGGASTLFTRPSWQTGVTGIPSGTFRVVPDVALYSSPQLPGFLYCTGDASNWVNGQQASCNNGFRDNATGDLTVAGGTSFDAPIFAGMVAVVNQSAGYATGQGLFNTQLYKIAGNSYPGPFHDITSGNNFCTAGTTYGYCGSNGATLGYAAGTGYDQVTGLGSVDLAALATALTPSTSAAVATATKITASNTNPDLSSADTITIQVTQASGSTPTGSVNLLIDQTLGSNHQTSGGATASATLNSSGQAMYNATFTTWGAHSIVAQYGGDSTHAASTGTISFDIIPFRLAASPASVTVSQGKSGTSTITITSQHSYAGTVAFTLAASSTALSQDGCYKISNTAVSANGTATATLTLYTSQSACTAAGAVTGGGVRKQLNTGAPIASALHGTGTLTALPVGATAMLSLLLFGARFRRSKIVAVVSCLFLLGVLGLAVGCGGGSSSSSSGGGGGTSTAVPKGTYALSLTGYDSGSCTATTASTGCGAETAIGLTLTVN